jgi:hypothetical protein
LDSRRETTRGSPKTLQKIKNTYEVGKTSEQRRKSREDVKPYKVMQGSVR